MSSTKQSEAPSSFIKSKNPWIALILAILLVPFGYAYIGKIRRGLIITAFLIAWLLAINTGIKILWFLAILDVFLLAIDGWGPFDVLKRWNLG